VNAALEPLIAAASFVVSTTVGTAVTTEELRRVASRPRAIVIATVAQWLLLPIVALVIVISLRPPELVAVALLLAASCPGGALANAYVYLAGADTTLSVVITVVSTVAAVATLPAVLTVGLALAGLRPSSVPDPWRQVLVALLVAVLVPVLLGLVLRHRWPAAVARHERRLRGIAALGVLAVVAMIVVDQWSPLGRYAATAIVVALAYGTLCGASGYAAGAVAGLPRDGRFTVGVDLVCRNMAIFALVTVSGLMRPELLVIGVVFFLAQATIGLVGGALWRRRHGRPRG
jgi:bile acid:Na+ symporter, BASS family